MCVPAKPWPLLSVYTHLLATHICANTLLIAGTAFWSAGGVEWVLVAPWSQGAQALGRAEAESGGCMSGAPG